MPPMQLEDHFVVRLVGQIRTEFANVRLGEGISICEANVIDDYGSDEERATARAGDEHQDWSRIPAELIEKLPHVFCFMDLEGIRFHLPAFMVFSLQNYQQSSSLSVDTVVFRLCNTECISRLKPTLTISQTSVIIEFLKFCHSTGDQWLSFPGISTAIAEWLR